MANKDMVTITIDGQPISVPKGENLIESAKRLGINIPHYCYHPKLSVAGNCRMCMVEVEKMPKLTIACNTGAQEGMVVHTKSKKTVDAQKMVMEFLLINHPLDCPFCDQAGECKLQDYYMAHGMNGSHFKEEKLHKEKAKRIGQHVVLDQERCINCTRCVRFMNEIAKDPVLGQFERNNHAHIDIMNGKTLDHPYSLNTVEICPVGALTSGDDRFKVRVWFQKTAKSICPSCATGCNTYLDFTTRQENKLVRFRSRRNDFINDTWLCDYGRLSKSIFSDEAQKNLIDTGFVKDKDGNLEDVSYQTAVKELVSKLRFYITNTNGDNLASNPISVIGSYTRSNEEIFALAKFASFIHAKTFSLIGRPQGESDGFLLSADRNPNKNGAEMVSEAFGLPNQGIKGVSENIQTGSSKVIILFGVDNSNFLENVWKETLSKAELVISISERDSWFHRFSHLIIPLSRFGEYEGSFVNISGFIQKFERTSLHAYERHAGWEIVSDLLKAFGNKGFENVHDVFAHMRELLPLLKNQNLDFATLGVRVWSETVDSSSQTKHV